MGHQAHAVQCTALITNMCAMHNTKDNFWELTGLRVCQNDGALHCRLKGSSSVLERRITPAKRTG